MFYSHFSQFLLRNRLIFPEFYSYVLVMNASSQCFLHEHLPYRSVVPIQNCCRGNDVTLANYFCLLLISVLRLHFRNLLLTLYVLKDSCSLLYFFFSNSTDSSLLSIVSQARTKFLYRCLLYKRISSYSDNKIYLDNALQKS